MSWEVHSENCNNEMRLIMGWSNREGVERTQYKSEKRKLEESFTDEVIYKVIKYYG